MKQITTTPWMPYIVTKSGYIRGYPACNLSLSEKHFEEFLITGERAHNILGSLPTDYPVTLFVRAPEQPNIMVDGFEYELVPVDA